MPKDTRESIHDGERSLTPAAKLARLALIGAAVLAMAGAFAYAGGWLSPRRLTPARMIGAFEENSGVHPGFRRNHAKGVCVSGWFDSSGAAAAVSKAQIFKAGRVPVIGRFALAGGLPMQGDEAATVRSMALRFVPPGGEEWRTGMNNIPVFPVNSARGFYDQLLASMPDPATGKPDPKALRDFLARHPETVHAMAIIKARTVSSGFADSTFNSLDAFRFVNAAGRILPVRWATVPAQSFMAQTAAQSSDADKNYLFDELITQIHQHPLQWHLMITIGQPDDPTNDATLPWPADRQRVDAGTVIIDSVSSEDGGSCNDVNYDPLVLPSGIEPTDDPLLSARSAAYSRSFTLRAGEKGRKVPSAITTQAARSGGRS
jgi:catalase